MAINYLDTGDTGRAVSSESDGALFAGILELKNMYWKMAAS